MIKFSKALNLISGSLDSDLNWAITGGANLALRTGSEFANDLDIICLRSDMPSIVKSLSSVEFLDQKSNCGYIRSVFHSEKIFDVKIEIMSDVENFICDTWVPNHLFLECIERSVEVNGHFVNLMSVAYEVHINALIGNIKLCNRFLSLK